MPAWAGEFPLEKLRAGALPACAGPEAPAAVPAGEDIFRRVEVGEFRSRGYYAPGGGGLRPAILLLPGSGPSGPEGMVPGKFTLDKVPAPLLLQAARPFAAAGFHVLALGKPGVEFLAPGAEAPSYYDTAFQKEAYWAQLLKNAREGIKFLRAQPGVDPARVWILGHSEGTQVASDIGAAEGAAGLVLLGYSGEDLSTAYRWQMGERQAELFIKTDVDADKDGFVSRGEASAWKEFYWPWQEGQENISMEDITDALKAQGDFFAQKLLADPGCGDGHCARGPVYGVTAAFPGPVYAFTGELDVRTRPREALLLKEECSRRGKADCFVEIVPGVQHGFSAPRPPRAHPLLDETLGSAGPELLSLLGRLAGEIAGRR